MRLFRQLLTTVGTFGALIVLVVQVTPSGKSLTSGQKTLLAVAVVAFVAQIAFDVVDFLSAQPKRFRSGLAQEEKVRNFMFRWIDSGGRVAVFSNDLSWVADDEMRDLLRRKAQRGELILVTPKVTDLTQELAEAGAETIHYEQVDYVIRSRFTITQFERADGAVAIGHRAPNGDHLVETFTTGSHPAFALAMDLVEILRRPARGTAT